MLDIELELETRLMRSILPSPAPPSSRTEGGSIFKRSLEAILRRPVVAGDKRTSATQVNSQKKITTIQVECHVN